MKWKVTAFMLLIILLLSGTVYAGQDRYEVHFLDTGQSDCILIKGRNKNYLIDTGASYYSDKVLEYLNTNHINNIDTIILTHYHDDHYGGLLKIVENKKVGIVLLPDHYNEIKEDLYKNLVSRNVEVKYIEKGFKLKKGKINLKVIGPIKEDKTVENNNSIVLQGKIDGVKFLFAADCEKEEEKDLIDCGELEQCDILKLPHHCLNTSSTVEFIDTVKPKLAIVTCNGVETPDEYILKRLYERGIMVFRTDIRGNVIVKNGFVKGMKDGITVRVNDG